MTQITEPSFYKVNMRTEKYGESVLSQLLARSQNCEKRLLSSCLSVLMKHRGFHCTDFHED